MMSICCCSVRPKPGMSATPSRLASSSMTKWLVRGPSGGSISFGPSDDVLVAAALVDVVMLEEHGGRQHDVGELGRVGHELLVHAGEQVVAQEALLHQPLLGRDIGRVGVLDQHRRHRRAAIERVRGAGQHLADARLVEIADRADRAARVPSSIVLVELEDARIGMEGAAALILPAPVTAAMQDAACMLTEPLRWRAKP